MTADTTWTDRSDADDAEFAEVLAKWEAAPAAEESFDATAALRRVLALADELDREGDERERMADRLPNQPGYHMEINRLVVAAEHQHRAAKQIRRQIRAAVAGEP